MSADALPGYERADVEKSGDGSKRSNLKGDGVLFSGPEAGNQACGDVGEGRLREPAQILEDVEAFFTPSILSGKKVLMMRARHLSLLTRFEGSPTDLPGDRQLLLLPLQFAPRRGHDCQRSGLRVLPGQSSGYPRSAGSRDV